MIMYFVKERHELISQLRNITSHNIGILYSFDFQSQTLTTEKLILSKGLCTLKIYTVSRAKIPQFEHSVTS